LILAPSQFYPTSQTEGLKIQFHGIGAVYEDKTDRFFENTFGSIKHQFSQNASVIFDGCNSYCAQKSVTLSFAQRIGKYFGITSGSVFASQVPNSYRIPISTTTLIRPKSVIYSVMAGLVAATAMTPFVDSPDVQIIQSLQTWLSYVGAGTIFFLPAATVGDIMKRTYERFKSKGILVRLSSGEVSTRTQVSNFEWSEFPETSGRNRISQAIMTPITCAARLSGKAVGLVKKVVTRRPK
jgi:hypothetical protein